MEDHRTAAAAPPPPDRSGVLDEALDRIHAAGPGRDGRIGGHAPMAVEALVRQGRAGTVHRRLDRCQDLLEGHAHAERRGDRRELALGGPRRTADRARRFERETAEPLTHRPRRVVAPAARPVWRAAPPLR
ncbi:hypothetical protein [Streptomyces clavuligerus]|uniref:Uncharacterized protein n=1 Tax=Streptomyces clavuligerus TaxID=1901 RepID=E2Q7K3_STRCL|nr:hypothetical protein [Streptomyces clavuligerus]ANW19747.1 hypothetical protein BB341_16725 [Streptomyces clavuligerus]AXU14361.1 hypothetical protein D1794_17470 [Streptomyces clavuligerus]EFG07409.1 Hypothetical protein SCLAV_2336 [Streptomyces clavuligerus]MBY6304364.1 hypothetical protein [Streptomyces clavuligerus]QCS07135.1 hypothetical protein CRV15_16825 [Streptomyces clavuligerus]